ncbi:MAG: hypothetical protein L6R30_09045, partial [Thermoanaerobaculia bacterium]|nr:hypothetical protein [Thermoanaerobaculia bacterium]
LTIAQPGLREGAIYNRAVRKKLLLAAQATYEDEVHLVGEVRAADKDTEGFFLRVAGGARVQVKALPLFFPVALKSLQESALVRVRGTGVFDADGTLLRVTSATDVSSAEEGDEVTTKGGCGIPVLQQIEALGALQPGWYDSESPAYETENLGWLEKLLEGLLDGFNLPVPYVYPTPEGRVRIEWPGAHQEIVVTFDLMASSADAMVVHLDSDEFSELAVSFKKPGAESRLGSFIARHVSAE